MPTRYKSRDKIIRAIDVANKRREKLKVKAQEALDEEELLRGTDAVAEHRKAKELADKHLRAVKRLEDRRLPKLQRVLAEFDTIPLGEAANVEGLTETGVAL
jgi:hypothetical protein